MTTSTAQAIRFLSLVCLLLNGRSFHFVIGAADRPYRYLKGQSKGGSVSKGTKAPSSRKQPKSTDAAVPPLDAATTAAPTASMSDVESAVTGTPQSPIMTEPPSAIQLATQIPTFLNDDTVTTPEDIGEPIVILTSPPTGAAVEIGDPIVIPTFAPTAGATQLVNDAPSVPPATEAPTPLPEFTFEGASTLLPDGNLTIDLNETFAPVDTEAPLETEAPIDTEAPIFEESSMETLEPVDTAAPVDTEAPIDTLAPSSEFGETALLETDAPLDTDVPLDSIVPTATPAPSATDFTGLGSEESAEAPDASSPTSDSSVQSQNNAASRAASQHVTQIMTAAGGCLALIGWLML